jgi:hypothetical protein
VVCWCLPLQAAEWADTLDTDGFQVRANFELSSVCPNLVPELVQLERDLVELLQLEPRREPVHLLLFEDRASYERYLKRYFRGAPMRRALFIKGTQPGWVFAYLHAEFEVDVRHETTHALLHSRLAVVPLWLDEGLAEYFEVPVERRREGNPHQTVTRWSARFHRAPDLRRLEDLTELREMGSAEYRAAWAWTHFLLHGPTEAHATLVQYLSDIEQVRPTARISDRLDQSLPNPQAAFLQHHR